MVDALRFPALHVNHLSLSPPPPPIILLFFCFCFFFFFSLCFYLLLLLLLLFTINSAHKLHVLSPSSSLSSTKVYLESLLSSESMELPASTPASFQALARDTYTDREREREIDLLALNKQGKIIDGCFKKRKEIKKEKKRKN